ncbi:TIGR03621 family F420-dependent LLM class oxidoreductase [Amycolatopsis acididurans]|nr:TIGR03621 family F420-dependent LLM class oxidoreductase [Amycolatopsis acididurans]
MRFGVSMRAVGDDFAAKCRRAEELGYDVITVPDHLGAPAPFPALVAAAAATERLRVGPMVLNAPFYNPALLARDIESTVAVTGGRFDLGIGAGHMKSEFDDAGLPWWPAKRRIEYLDHTLTELRRRLGKLPPLLIAGNSEGVLRLAAEHADIVGFSGLKQAPGRPPGTFQLATPDELAGRVEFVRSHATQAQQYNVLVQKVVVAEDPVPVLDKWHPEYRGEDLLRAPQILAGTVERITTELRNREQRFGFDYVTVFGPMMADFAAVIAEFRRPESTRSPA